MKEYKNNGQIQFKDVRIIKFYRSQKSAALGNDIILSMAALNIIG